MTANKGMWRAESRLARPILRLSDLLESEAVTGPQLAQVLEAARAAHLEWEERVAEEGTGKIWLAITGSDPLQSAGSWIEELTRMELAWCARLGLTASVVAYGQVEDELGRAVLEVEGPGAVLRVPQGASSPLQWPYPTSSQP